MNREELFKMHADTCSKALTLMKAKNLDYSANEDPFGNFKVSESFGISSEMGILLRCLDKFKRIESFVRRGSLKVKDESVDDTIRDVINYMVLLKGIIADKKQKGK